MTRRIAIILFCAGLSAPAWAQPADPPPPACNDSAYVPGVDAYGRSVVPADANPPVTVEVSPVVVTQLTGRGNPVVDNTLAAVRVNGLDRAVSPPPCLPLPRPAPRR